MHSVLDERFTLNDLLEPALLKEVCQVFSQCFDLGVVILSEKEVELVSSGQDRPFCKMVQTGAAAKCEEVRRKLARHAVVDSATSFFQSKAFCGLRYAFVPLYHQFEFLGRVIVGPFRDPETSVEMVQNLVGQELKRPVSADHLQKIPVLDQKHLKLIIRLLTKFLDAFLFINAKRLITTRLHLETIYSSRESIFRQMDIQNTGTSEDKEEIEKLKNIF